MQFKKMLRSGAVLSLLFLFSSFLLSSTAGALHVSVSFPKDEFITFDDLVFIEGLAKETRELKINNRVVEVAPDGFFRAGLVLTPGKNFVEIVAQGKGQKVERLTRRILRLVRFPDVEKIFGHKGQKYWARDRIIELATLGLIEAYPDNNFYPRRHISRGEMATWLARVKNLKLTKPAQDIFYDVPREHWRAPSIQAVVSLGYMRGFKDDLFWIDDGIFRGGVAGIMVKAEGGPLTGEARAVFQDVPLTHKDAFWIYQAYRKGFVLGVSKRKKIYDPDRFMSRAEAVMLLSRDPGVRSQVNNLFNLNRGFSAKNFCFVNTAPQVKWVKATPDTFYVKEKKVVVFTAKILDREGLDNLASVTIDLTSLDGPPDARMYDDGTNGDKQEGDGVFTLKIVAEPPRSEELKIRVHAVDQYTFEGRGETTLKVLE